MADYIEQDIVRRAGFIDFLASRWAPVGVTNDPTQLNANWDDNVEKSWKRNDPS
jgi:hypothetical protein